MNIAVIAAHGAHGSDFNKHILREFDNWRVRIVHNTDDMAGLKREETIVFYLWTRPHPGVCPDCRAKELDFARQAGFRVVVVTDWR